MITLLLPFRLALLLVSLFCSVADVSGFGFPDRLPTYHRTLHDDPHGRPAAAISNNNEKTGCCSGRMTMVLDLAKRKGELSSDAEQQNASLYYNDDGFGFVFLIGGASSGDVDFAGTFLGLSAVAAITAKAFGNKADTRSPAAVAALTLLVSPVVKSMRTTGSLEGVVAPVPVEIAVCAISSAWAFVKWSKERESE